ncbi:MAG: PEP/pyruvate-binding domain-containing protein [Propioniciclava sp.]
MPNLAPDLRQQGGKGANLVRLEQAGLPVPTFVILDTDEYRSFVSDAGLGPVISAALDQEPAPASERIRAAFAAASLTDDQTDRLLRLIAPFATTAVAVRSSATAEDLPGYSFAGQQDTFLDVRGTEAVLAAVVECWSSLWTERAISYRQRNEIPQDDVALAVVVQELVPADASGVMFTANPRTGRRDEIVVDAVLGLGEALVSGQVTPDSFTLDSTTGAIGNSALAGPTPAVSETQLRQLARLGARIQNLYGEPMDIEWARVGDELSILQARPVTSLYPLPDLPGPPSPEPEAWFSFGAFQGMLEPVTPLGQDMLRILMCGTAQLANAEVDWRTNRFVAVAGERVWIRVDGLARTRMTRAVLTRLLPLAEPTTAALLDELLTEPGFAVTRAVPQGRLIRPMSRVLAQVAARIRATRIDPATTRQNIEREAAAFLTRARSVAEATGVGLHPQTRLSARVAALEELAGSFFPLMLPLFPAVMVPTMTALTKLRAAAARTGLPDADLLAMSVLRALPGNVTTEMDLAVGDVAAAIRADASAWGWVTETSAADLARSYLAGNLPATAQRAVGAYLDDYGMRGVAEIDFGAPRWRDDPEPVMRTLKAAVEVVDPDEQPRALHTAGQHEAGRSLRRLMDASGRADAARIRSWARTIRGVFGARETPKFTIIRMFGLLRDQFGASGRDLVAEGVLDEPGDIYFLHLDELGDAFTTDRRRLVAERRARYRAEQRRGQIPHLLVSDGRALYPSITDGADLSGTGVSPGVAEGTVHIIGDPRTEQLERGEILVCRGTDPAWTPLFLTAAGLVTEVGGLMTHGSVVAREYGIPAVVGVPGATQRLTTGQRVRIDGTSGTIALL